jgi:opacity protein-like surface antigen
MLRVLALTTAVLVSFLSSGASAKDAFSPGPYVQLDAGLAIVGDSDVSLFGVSGEAKFDPGFAVGGAIGYRIEEWLRAEVNLSYRQAEVDKLTAPGYTLEGAGDASAFATLVNLYIDFMPRSPVTPYVGAGIGVAIIDVDSDDSANVLIVNDDSTEFAWNVMAGAAWSVTDDVVLTLGYRYFSSTDAQLDATLVGVGSGTMDVEFGVHEMMFGARYNF